MTSKELDERIDSIRGVIISYSLLSDARFKKASDDDIKQLIRDCIEAVTPERSSYRPVMEDVRYRQQGYEAAIDTIKANTKELLG